MTKKNLHPLLSKLAKKNVTSYGHDFLQTWDKTLAELEATLLTAETLLAAWQANLSPRVFASGLAVSWFRDKSTRTRFSFKSAADLLGLSVQDLDEQTSQISHGETTRESANMISFLTDIIGIRDDKYLGFGHTFQREVAESVEEGYRDGILPQRPSVINLQCDRDHPTQSLADLMHLKTYFGDLSKLKGKKLVMSWAYSPSYGKPLSVAQGTIGLMTRFGMDVVLAHPQGYHLIPELQTQAKEFAKKSGGSFTITNNMTEAFKNADVVYPKSWASYKAMERRAALYQKNDPTGIARLEKAELAENAQHQHWTCTEKLMQLTNNGRTLYLHCLPADVTGVSCKLGEVEASVFDRYRVQTFKQAGFKPYIIAAMIILTTFGPKTATVLRQVLAKRQPRKS